MIDLLDIRIGWLEGHMAPQRGVRVWLAIDEESLHAFQVGQGLKSGAIDACA